MKAFVIYPTYRIIEDKAKVYLFGRLENGESFLSMSTFRPYFYVKKKDLDKAKKIKTEPFDVEEPGFRNFDGEEVVKIILDVPNQLTKARTAFQDSSISCYEADIRFPYRFMMDQGILGSCDISGKYKKGNYVDRIYEDPGIKPAAHLPKLKVLSIDIETDAKAKKLYSISLYTDDYKKVLIISDKKYKNCIPCKDEGEILEKFKQKVEELDPDIITGWNVIDFDIAFLQDKFKEHKLDFFLGRAEWPCKLRIESDFFRTSKAEFPGRMVLDGIDLLRTSFIALDNYKLDTAAKEILGDKKLITQNKGKEIEDAFKNDKQKLIDYNLHDAELVYRILEKSGALNLSIQRSLTTGMPLDRVSATVASLDSLYLRELRKLKVAAPSMSFNEREERIKGGYVMQSKPGIYDYIIVEDFKSLYPSIMLTFNIDPYSYLGQDVKAKNTVRTPNGACFRNDSGVLPSIITRLWAERDKAKKSKNKIGSYALKILMNSFFGALANPTCRFYSLDVANAITHSGQMIIKKTAEVVNDMGYEVIYSDTDSIFVKSGAGSIEEAEKTGNSIQKKIDVFYSDFIKKEYSRKNYLDLQFEKVFVRFLMPKLRGTDVGSKKRYAGLVMKDGKEEIEFTGLEFVRRDWTELSKIFQHELLDRIFHKKEVGEYIRKFVSELKKGKYDDLLIYRKAIRKNLDEYVKTTPPHVKAARKLKEINSNIIEYVITVNGPEPIRQQKSSIDYEHYIEKQIKPLADSLLSFFNQSFDDVLKNAKQATLLKY